MKLKFIDLFAGIGGTRIGIEEACKELGIEPECVLSSEIDNSACETYRLNFAETPAGDIKQITDIKPFDFLLAGFPCQPFSYAGKHKGFVDTRGTLFFEIERILKKSKPNFFLLENVRGLTTHDKGRTFKTIISSLENLGYGVTYLLLNSSNFGVPQNRVRIYILGRLGKKPVMTLSSDKGAADSHKFKNYYAQTNLFRNSNYKVIKDILEENVDNKYKCSPKFVNKLKELIGKDLSKLDGVRFIDYRNGRSIHSWELGMKGECTEEEIKLLNLLIKNRRKKIFGAAQDGKRLSIKQIKSFYDNSKVKSILNSLVKKGYLKEVGAKYNPVAGNMSFEVFKFLDPNSISVTLVSSDANKLGIVVNNKPRRITPREAARIQGFPDTFSLNPKDPFTYKQLGNSVSVPVVRRVLRDFLKNNLPKASTIEDVGNATKYQTT